MWSEIRNPWSNGDSLLRSGWYIGSLHFFYRIRWSMATEAHHQKSERAPVPPVVSTVYISHCGVVFLLKVKFGLLHKGFDKRTEGRPDSLFMWRIDSSVEERVAAKVAVNFRFQLQVSLSIFRVLDGRRRVYFTHRYRIAWKRPLTSSFLN